MEHLNGETLARLVDELPMAVERRHLDECDACARELDDLRQQTDLLSRLPDVRPPRGDWESLEARLVGEGLVDVGSRAGHADLAVTPRWMRAAAAVALFLGGGLVGAATMARAGAALSPTAAAPETVGTLVAAGPADPGAALAEVERAERDYIAALVHYRQLTSAGGTGEAVGDPAVRYAALEELVRAGQLAVRQAPADPFLNGLLASAMAEQQAVYRGITTAAAADEWF